MFRFHRTNGVRTTVALTAWLLLCSLGTVPAGATGYATSDVTVDWTGLSFTVTAGLTITQIADGGESAASRAVTSAGAPSSEVKHSWIDPLSWSETAALSTYTQSTGAGQGQGSTHDGLLIGHSQAMSISQEASINSAGVRLDTNRSFWLYGTGVGALTVSVPYTLAVACSATQSPPDRVSATATAGLVMSGLAVGNNVAVACDDVLARQGVLTVEMNVANPTFGPLFNIAVSATTSATANVPEPSATWLLALALGMVGLVGWWGTPARRRISTAMPRSRERR